jgi:C4-dicarboxylate transporter, DctM subunit
MNSVPTAHPDPTGVPVLRPGSRRRPRQWRWSTRHVALRRARVPRPAATLAAISTGIIFRGGEDRLAGAILLVMAILPLVEILLRATSGTGVPGAMAIVQHLTLWIALVGAALAAREKRLLAMGTAELIRRPAVRRAARVATSALAAAISALLARGALDLVLVERGAGGVVALGVPVWVAQLVIPGAFTLIALRLVWHADAAWTGRLMALMGLAGGLAVSHAPFLVEGLPAWVAVLGMAGAAVLGLPLFAAIGGLAALLFLGDAIPLAALPAETYRLAVSPTLSAIPLFTVAGFLLAEGGVSSRLLRLFRAYVGWMPGGTAVVLALIFAFFTVFTGGSGVTILALGALGFQALRADGYPDRFSVGLLTGSASLGLLLPPALPLILYGIVAGVSIPDLFIAGIVPGVLLIGLTAGWAVRQGLRSNAPRAVFRRGEALAALGAAKWDLLLPVVVVVAVFGGFATLVEAAALTAAYAFLLQTVIHRDVSVRRDLGRILTHAAVLLGGVLVILAVAMGLTNFLVDAQVPTLALAWVQERVSSPLMFLLLLNLLLLVVGCLLDIFSATVVVAPLLVPLGLAYGVDPVHLGIIFIANLELGYLTPPVGLNLFLASYRFERSLGEVARSVLPLLGLYAVGVALITYVPWLTVGVLALLRP